MGYVKATSAKKSSRRRRGDGQAARAGRVHQRNLDLATSVRDQLASVRPWKTLDLTDIMPALEFDPRWES